MNRVAAVSYTHLDVYKRQMQEFKKNNVFGATAFSTYGAFWLSLATLVVFEALGVINWGGHGGTALGIFLLGFTIFNTYMWIASFRTNGAVCAVFTTLEITFILLVIAEFGIISSVPGGIKMCIRDSNRDGEFLLQTGKRNR